MDSIRLSRLKEVLEWIFHRPSAICDIKTVFNLLLFLSVSRDSQTQQFSLHPTVAKQLRKYNPKPS